MSSTPTSRNREAIRQRIELLLNFLASPDVINEGTKLQELSSYLNVSERTIRNFIKDLAEYGIIEELSAGVVRLSPKLINILDPTIQKNYDPLDHPSEINIYSPEVTNKTIEEFILSMEQIGDKEATWKKSLLKLTGSQTEVTNILKFLEKIESPLHDWELIKQQIETVDPAVIKDAKQRIMFHGYKLTYRILAKALPVSCVFFLAGVSNRTRPRAWWIHGVASLFPVLLSTSAHAVGFNGTTRVGKARKLVYPIQKTLKEEELPQLPEIEIPELITSYGDISEIPLRIASRLMATSQLYDIATQMLEECDEHIHYLFFNGTLFPHGFFYPGGQLTKIVPAYLKVLREVSKSFATFLRKASTEGTKVIGYSTVLKDIKFSSALFTYLQLPNLKMQDSMLMSQLLQDRDASCLFQRIEAGKPEFLSKQTYEFYLNIRDEIADIELLKMHGNDDIYQLQKEIASIVYQTSPPFKIQSIVDYSDQQGITVSMPPVSSKYSYPLQQPFVLREALNTAELNLWSLEQLFDRTIFELEAKIRSGLANLYNSSPIFNNENNS